MVCYKCEKCNKEFLQKSNYTTHINRKKPCIIDENITNVNTIIYKCEKCNKEFNQKSNYTAHINKKNPCNANENITNVNTIIYKCEKCNKEFNKKSNYLSHINKKNPCNSNDLINQNIKLLDRIKELEKQKSYLKSKNNYLVKRTNVLRGNICTLKIEMLEKQELLNNNKKNNDEDIKIKMVQEYVYIIRECDFVRLNEDIYKIGRTAKTNPEDRFQKYRKGTEIVAFFKVNNSIECENKMIKCFSNHINIKKRSEYGKEYFEGNRNELLNEIVQIVKNYNN
jgi:uncharacterized C2H2 Zn-finger protein